MKNVLFGTLYTYSGKPTGKTTTSILAGEEPLKVRSSLEPDIPEGYTLADDRIVDKK